MARRTAFATAGVLTAGLLVGMLGGTAAAIPFCGGVGQGTYVCFETDTAEVVVCAGGNCAEVVNRNARGNLLALSRNGHATSNLVAVSPNGKATSTYGAAVSQNGHAYNYLGAAVSPNGHADNELGAAVSPNGHARSTYGAAVSQNGHATSHTGAAVSQNRHADNDLGATVSQNGNADNQYGAAVSQNGNAKCSSLGCVAVSVTGQPSGGAVNVRVCDLPPLVLVCSGGGG